MFRECISKPSHLAALLCVSLTGCTVGPALSQAPATVPAAPNYKESPVNFHDANGWKVASPQDAMLHGNWWEIFNQPELNDLESQLNINNQNIKVYFENYLAARAQIREARAQYLPDRHRRGLRHALAHRRHCQQQRRPNRRWDIFCILPAPRYLLGARPLRPRPQHRSRIPGQRPSQRRRPRKRASPRTSHARRNIFRNSRTRRPASSARRHRQSRRRHRPTRAGALRRRHRHRSLSSSKPSRHSRAPAPRPPTSAFCVRSTSTPSPPCSVNPPPISPCRSRP